MMKKRTDLTGEVLVTMNGEPIVTTDSLTAEKQRWLETNQEQLERLLPHMDPKTIDDTLIQGLTNQAVIDRYINEAGIDETSAYQEELAHMKRELNLQFFCENINLNNITDEEAQEKKFEEEVETLKKRYSVEIKKVVT